ncbi:M10 family metallopeptidase C-terminal domain-containing protein [Neorhizobium sp. NCHU2750]|uniref:M10 family metallopeptidase C-terminal domain-containing protein n=1 Tax=Neorhizobium sp. NCHU2750 TaxID=1825976 RepID=UPI000E773663|nr:serralysin [Neorhizobium sp. NCHU2750]
MTTYKENADAAAGVSTAYKIAPGDALTGSLTIGDSDWIKIGLTAGKAYQFDVTGTVGWATLLVTDADGIALDIDINNRDNQFTASTLKFVPEKTGTYYIRVGSHDDEWSGKYTLKTAVVATPKFASYDAIATQLTTNFWKSEGSAPYKFDIRAGDTLTVNIASLTSQGQQLAKWALTAWTEASGIKFKYVSGAAQISFDDKESGSFGGASSIIGGHTVSGIVNVAASWIKSYGAGPDSYVLETYIHEIGHALGLGHAGNYNGNAIFGTSNLFSNDSDRLTVMSYFDAQENPWVAASPAIAVTPMMVDILAIRALYGTTAINAGNTKYDLKADFDGKAIAMTLVDTGGTDTFDFSWAAATQKIDLNAEKFSNVAGGISNLALARGTVIENAIGGKGVDVITGNSAANTLDGRAGNDKISGAGGNDKLYGGAGSDTLSGGSGKDAFVFNTALGSKNVDLINDFSPVDDVIHLENAIFTSFTKTGAISSASFIKGTTPAAKDANDFLIYETDTGNLYYDANGNKSGGPVLFVHLQKDLALTYQDFLIV